MGVRILTDRQSDYPQAVLYCSTSDWAFGPVFNGNGEHDADERAEAFPWNKAKLKFRHLITNVGSYALCGLNASCRRCSSIQEGSK